MRRGDQQSSPSSTRLDRKCAARISRRAPPQPCARARSTHSLPCLPSAAEVTETMASILDTMKSTAEQMKNSVNQQCASPRSPCACHPPPPRCHPPPPPTTPHPQCLSLTCTSLFQLSPLHCRHRLRACIPRHQSTQCTLRASVRASVSERRAQPFLTLPAALASSTALTLSTAFASSAALASLAAYRTPIARAHSTPGMPRAPLRASCAPPFSRARQYAPPRKGQADPGSECCQGALPNAPQHRA